MKREFFNLYGISFTVFGDVDKARSLAYQARRMHFQRELVGVPRLNLNYSDGSFVNVLREAERNFASIYVPEKIEEKKKKESIVIREFLPSICMVNTEDSLEYYYFTYEFTTPVVVSVCSTPYWKGSLSTVDSYAPYAPGMKTDDIISFGLFGLENYGFSNFHIYDYETDRNETIQWDSWPDNDTLDEIWDYYPFGLTDPETGQTPREDLCTLWPTNPDGWLGWPEYNTSTLCFSTHEYESFEMSNTFNTCGDTYTTVHRLYQTAIGGYQYQTWSVIYMRYYEVTQTQTTTLVMGICFETVISCDESIVNVLDGYNDTVGEQYTYEDKYEYTCQTYGKGYPIADRPGGIIQTQYFDNDYSWGNIRELLNPCSCQRTDYINDNTPYPSNAYIGGAYVPTDNEDENLTDKYIILYCLDKQSTYKNHVHSDCDSAAGSFTYTYPEDLYVEVNGVPLIIDTLTEQSRTFLPTDGHIFTLDGNIYYMYAYHVWESGYGIVYTRYGYFKNSIENHYSSEKFYPVGFTKNGYITPHHDVAGSSKLDPPVYGIGKCSGYLHTYEKEII